MVHILIFFKIEWRGLFKLAGGATRTKWSPGPIASCVRTRTIGVVEVSAATAPETRSSGFCAEV
jgi:hypothetical protein